MDAFSQNWNHLYSYAFPPFLLVGRTLQKIQHEGVQRAVVIAPTWPRQPWFLLLLHGDDNRPTNLPPTVQEPTAKPIGDNASSTGGESTTLSCVAGVRDSLQKQGISQEAADIICSSWRKSREKSYTSAWNKWSS